LDMIREAVRRAEELAEREGGSFEGWLWALTMPFAFLHRGNKIELHYPVMGFEEVVIYEVDRRTHEVRKRVEYVEDE